MQRLDEAWIPIQERLPTESDGDERHCVLAWHMWQGVIIVGWHNVNANRFHTHWMHTPLQPKNAQALCEEWNERNLRMYDSIK